MNSLIYLLQVTACTAVFYLFYYLFLSRLTFFTTNRWYLLATVILSFTIPAIKIQVNEPHVYTGVVQQVVSVYVPETSTEPPILQHRQKNIQTPLQWDVIIKYVYLAAVLALTIHLTVMLVGFFKQVKGKRITKLGNVNVFSGNKTIANGSFLNNIFLNDDELSADEVQQIIAHEMLHIKLYHSIDRIIVKIAQIILWFNPFIYLYARSVEENHEFEVDRAMALNNDKHNYANLLLHLSVAGNGMLYHNFSKVPLKKRITMLFNKPSNNMRKIIYLLIVPMLVISCLAFAKIKSDKKPAKSQSAKSINKDPYANNPAMKAWLKSKYYKGYKKLGGLLNGKTIEVKVKSITYNDHIKNKVDLISFDYQKQAYEIAFNYGNELTRSASLKEGDLLKINVSGLATHDYIRKLNWPVSKDTLIIVTKEIYKDGKNIFKMSPLTSKNYDYHSKLYNRTQLNGDSDLVRIQLRGRFGSGGASAETNIAHAGKVAFFVNKTLYTEAAFRKFSSETQEILLTSNQVGVADPEGFEDMFKSEGFQSNLTGYAAAFFFRILETDVTPELRASIDTPKYRQKVKLTPQQKIANEKANSYMQTDDAKAKQKLVREIYEAGEITVKITEEGAKKGAVFAWNGNKYQLVPYNGQSKVLKDLLKVGDEVKLKSFGAMFNQKEALITVEAAYVIKNNQKIFQMAEAAKIPDYPFLYESNKVRFTDGQISQIIKYPNGKWKTALFETVNGYKFNLNFKLTAPDLSSIEDGDHIRLRFINEVKTGAKSYRISNWVSISTDIKDYGVKNPEVFFKFYETVKANKANIQGKINVPLLNKTAAVAFEDTELGKQ